MDNRTDAGRYQVGSAGRGVSADPRYDSLEDARDRARESYHFVMAIWDLQARTLGGERVPPIIELWFEGDRWERT